MLGPVRQEILKVVERNGPNAVLEAAKSLFKEKHAGELDRAVLSVEEAVLELKLAVMSGDIKEIDEAVWELNKAAHKVACVANTMRYFYLEGGV